MKCDKLRSYQTMQNCEGYLSTERTCGLLYKWGYRVIMYVKCSDAPHLSWGTCP